MQEFISRKNIEKFQLLLSGDTLDEVTRKQIEELLDKELADQPRPKQPKEID